MKSVRAFHLPGLAEREATQAIDGTALAVPALNPSDVQQVSARLRSAARELCQESLAARVQRLAHACEKLRDRGPGRWREVLAVSTGLSHAGLDAAWDATFAPIRIETLRAALQAEALDDAALVEHDARLPRQILHVLAGNVLAPTVQMLTRGWLLGAAQWLRPASREPLFAVCVMSELESVAPALAGCTAVVWWPHASASEAAVIRSSDTVTVQGDDSSVEALRQRVERLHPRATFVGYGARWSAALLSEKALTPANARALANEVALFDQQGCLSPTVVFVERSPRIATWCGELARALADLESRMPRGRLTPEARAGLRHWHENARLKRVLRRIDGLWEESILWGVALVSDLASVDSPLDRHVIVNPFDRIEQLDVAMGARLERLQGLAIALDGWSAAARGRALARLNPSRAATVGTLQWPPPMWSQDHKPALASLFTCGRP